MLSKTIYLSWRVITRKSTQRIQIIVTLVASLTEFVNALVVTLWITYSVRILIKKSKDMKQKKFKIFWLMYIPLGSLSRIYLPLKWLLLLQLLPRPLSSISCSLTRTHSNHLQSCLVFMLFALVLTIFPNLSKKECRF